MLEQATQLVARLQEIGYEAYFVGGCVRDALLGIEPKDYDIVTTATTEDMLLIFHDHRILDVGAAFGVLKVLVDGVEYDLATARTDGEYSDSRRPDSIKPATIKEDIMRRDFTVNGILYDPVKEEHIDYVGGIRDVTDGVLRTIGNPPDRFIEDPLRILRAVRFATKYGFYIDPDTMQAIYFHVMLIDTVSRERVKMELDKIIMSDHVLFGFRLLANSGILERIDPVFKEMGGAEQNPKFHPEGNVLEHTIQALYNSTKDLTVRYALLLHDMGKVETESIDPGGTIRHKGHEKASLPIAEAFMERYKFDNKTKADILWLIGQHMRVRKVDEMGIYKQWELYAHPLFEKLLEVTYADSMSTGRCEEAIDFNNEKFKVLDHSRTTQKYKQMQKFTMITGDDCLKVGIEGEDIGKCLKILKKFYIEDRYKSREELLEHLEVHQNNYKEKK